ncbi:hypothetical protein [Streptomyces sp. NPDC091259]
MEEAPGGVDADDRTKCARAGRLPGARVADRLTLLVDRFVTR